MKTLFAIVLALGMLAGAASAQPACPSTATSTFCVAQVSNAASQALPPLQNSSIAQGSYFAIYGAGLAADISTCGTNYAKCIWPPSYPLPTSIQGTSVSVTVNGTTVSPYVEYAATSSGLSQINAVLPSNTPVGSGTLTVTYNGSTTPQSFPITVAASSFGTFTWSGGGAGPGILTNAVSYALLTPMASAKPTTASATGDYVTIWGTGLGPVDPSTEGTAAPTQTNLCGSGATCPVTVWVGGQQATVVYAGRSGYTAVDQIDFIVPSGAQGCYVQVAVQTGAVVGNFVSMPVDPAGGTCSDKDGINYADVAAAVAAKGKANIAAISLLSNYLPLSLFGTPVDFDNDSVNGEIATFSAVQLDSFQGLTISPSVGNCTVGPFQGFPPPKDPVLSGIQYLNAGSALQISGGQGPSPTQSVPLNANGKGYFQLVGGAYITCPADNPSCPSLLGGTAAQPYYLDSSNSSGQFVPSGVAAATYTVSGPGGADVGAFSGTLTVSSAAAAFKWTNQSIAGSPIPRNQPLNLTWSGGDPNGFVDITLIGSTTNALIPTSTTPGVLVECLVPGAAGSFAVPAYVLQALPSTAASTSPVAGEILIGPASGAVPIAPTPTGLDAAYLFYHFILGAPAAWQ